MLMACETAFAYVQQQREVTVTGVLLFIPCTELAMEKRKEAQKQTPITNFLKN
jgi:hypothetical protein